MGMSMGDQINMGERMGVHGQNARTGPQGTGLQGTGHGAETA
jgi:hypothetical protein